jgi:hypothetical protein
VVREVVHLYPCHIGQGSTRTHLTGQEVLCPAPRLHRLQCPQRYTGRCTVEAALVCDDGQLVCSPRIQWQPTLTPAPTGSASAASIGSMHASITSLVIGC